MDAEQLLQHFDRVAEAPGSIAALRRFILDLAVRGKLVDQDPNDEPASEKFEHLAELTTFDITTGWLSGKFGDLLNMQYGKSLPKESREQKGKGKVPIFGSNGVVGFTDVALVEQSVIVIGRKGSAGAINICREPSWTTDVAYFIIPPNFLDIRFLLFSLESLNLKGLSKGVKPGLSRSEAYQLSISIPPLPEQHRIVAKVDELMDLCDRLEAAQKNRESLRDRLVAASLHQLNQAADSNEEFFDRARFYFDNLAKLSVRSEHIKQLRQTVLNLALCGNLTTQNPDDEPASELLKQIQLEKIILEKEGKIKKEKPLKSFASNDAPFNIPNSWSWSKIQEIFVSVTDGDHLPPPKSSSGVPLLVIGNVRSKSIKFDGCRHVPEAYYQKLDVMRQPIRGDILYTLVGSYGIPVIVRDDRLFCVQRHIGILRPAQYMNVEFLAYVLESQLIFDQATRCATGIAQKTVTLTGLRNILCPLPPLAEQHRIVAKVNEMMTLCDRLESQINTTQSNSQKLLESLLDEALSETA